MNTIYGQDICDYGAGTLRNCGEGFGGLTRGLSPCDNKAVTGLRKGFSRFLRFATVLLLMVVGVNGMCKQGSDFNYGDFAINITKF